MIIQGNNLIVNGTSVDGTKLTNHDKITVDSSGNVGIGSTSIKGTFTPLTDNTYDLGGTSYRFANIYGVSVKSVSTAALYADLAEKYLTDEEYEYGTVVKIGGEKEVTKADKNDKAIGVISENPAYIMNSGLEGGQYIALKGRVPVKVTGKIKKGDKLVPSDAGYAMATSENTYNIFAIAINDSESGIVEAVIL